MIRLAFLTLLALALGSTIAFQLSGTPDELATVPPPEAGPVTAPPAKLRPVESRPDRTQVILARPLFSPQRRPVAEKAPEVASAAPGPLPRITGIILTPSRKSVMFAALGEGKPVVADEGGQIGAFLIQSIEPGRVTVVGPDGARVLHPSFNPDAPSPGTVQ